MTALLLVLSTEPVLGPGCEPLGDGLLREPISAVSSLAFVVAGIAVLLRARRATSAPARNRAVVILGALMIGVGLGSVAQHGPNPWWADLAHDLPLLATLAFLGADAVADLIGRHRQWWWWLGPTLALVPLIHLAPRAGDLAQVGVAVIAIALGVARAVRRPPLRRATWWALGTLAVSGVTGRLSDTGGPLCFPGGWWHGHTFWHVGASVALALLATVVGRYGRSPVGTRVLSKRDPEQTRRHDPTPCPAARRGRRRRSLGSAPDGHLGDDAGRSRPADAR